MFFLLIAYVYAISVVMVRHGETDSNLKLNSKGLARANYLGNRYGNKFSYMISTNVARCKDTMIPIKNTNPSALAETTNSDSDYETIVNKVQARNKKSFVVARSGQMDAIATGFGVTCNPRAPVTGKFDQIWVMDTATKSCTVQYMPANLN